MRDAMPVSLDTEGLNYPNVCYTHPAYTLTVNQANAASQHTIL